MELINGAGKMRGAGSTDRSLEKALGQCNLSHLKRGGGGAQSAPAPRYHDTSVQVLESEANRNNCAVCADCFPRSLKVTLFSYVDAPADTSASSKGVSVVPAWNAEFSHPTLHPALCTTTTTSACGLLTFPVVPWCQRCAGRALKQQMTIMNLAELKKKQNKRNPNKPKKT